MDDVAARADGTGVILAQLLLDAGRVARCDAASTFGPEEETRVMRMAWVWDVPVEAVRVLVASRMVLPSSCERRRLRRVAARLARAGAARAASLVREEPTT